LEPKIEEEQENKEITKVMSKKAALKEKNTGSQKRKLNNKNIRVAVPIKRIKKLESKLLK